MCSPETMRELCLSTKFPLQGIRWNYGILRSDHVILMLPHFHLKKLNAKFEI